MTGESTNGVEVFYAYAHKDEKLRDELKKHLSGLKGQELIKEWYEGDISPGTEWAGEIAAHLNTARIILLLVSPDFLASAFCQGDELKRAMERHEQGEACVIPILLRPVEWEKAPFGKLQPLPANRKPVTSWHDPDEAFREVARGIGEAIRHLRPPSPPPPPPPPSQSKLAWIVPYPRNPFFTDRKGTISDLHNTFTTDKATALIQQAIRGLCGIGKTQCALEYAYRHRDHYQAVLWTNAKSQETLVAGFVTIARRLHLSEQDVQDQSIALTAVKRWLETHTGWLLILDNADDLDLVDPFLPSEGEVEGEGHVLLTTIAHPIPLTMKRVTMRKMEPEDGVLFLLRRAQIIAPNASLEAASPEDRARASEIVQELGGLPLALEQAGAYIYETECSLSHYSHLYQTQHAALLKTRGYSLLFHVEPVATTWNVAFEKVQQANPAAVELLRLCAFLAPDAIAEEIISAGAPDLGPVLQPVATDPLQLDAAIRKLLKFSLVDRDPHASTLSIHCLVQTVLQDEMRDEDKRRWAECAVRAVNRVFPEVDVTTWSLCQRYVSQAQKCAQLIKDYQLLFFEAGRLLYATGHYLFDRAQFAQAEPLYQQALEIYQQVRGPEHADTASILHDLAWLYQVQDHYTQAEQFYRQAFSIRKQIPGAHCATASTLHKLAWLYKAHGQDKQRAEWLFNEARELCKQVRGAQDSDTARTLHELAWLYKDLEQYPEAEALFKEALKICQQVLGTEHPDTASTLHDLAWLYQDLHRYAEAEPLFKEALEIREQVLGLHVQAADTLHALAWFYRLQGRCEEAERFYRRALRMRKQVLGTAPATANTLYDFAWFCKGQGQYPEAERLFKEALKIRQQILGTEHPDTASTKHDLAWLYQDEHRYEQAEPLFKEALKTRKQMLGVHTQTAHTLYALGWLYLYRLQGRREEAERFFKEALEIRKQVLGPQHPDTASILHDLAWLYQLQGRREEAERFFKEALEIRERVLGPQHPATVDTREKYNALRSGASNLTAPMP